MTSSGESNVKAESGIRGLLFVVLTTGALVGIGCADRTNEADEVETAARSAPEDATDEGIAAVPGTEVTGETGTGMESGVAGDTGGGAPAPEMEETQPLADAEISATALAINSGEISLGELAVEKATDPQVKTFARKMIEDHTAMTQQVRGPAGEESVSPDPNTLGGRVTADAQNTTENLRAKSGAEFDRAYIESQVTMHQQALQTVDRLIQEARDPQLKSALEAARPKVQSHLEQAQQIQAQLQGSGEVQG